MARQYNPEVSGKIQLDLADFLKNQLYLSFDNQLKVVKNATLENFKKEIHKLEQKNLEDIANSVAKILGALLVNKLGSFERHTQALIFEGSGWEKHISLYRQELEATLKDAVANCKEKLLYRL